MNPDTYWYVLPGSLSGAVIGVLVMWNRKRSQSAGDSGLRRFVVPVFGTAASASALWAFSKAFGAKSSAYAALVTIALTGCAAVLQPVLAPLLPWRTLRVRAGEFALLRRSWSGVPLFGELLRSTPLRRLGGAVYLREGAQDVRVVLRGMQDAQTVHIAALLLCSPWLVTWSVRGCWASLACALAVHVPLNVYPILHLRYATWRIERYLAGLRKPRTG